MNLKEKLLKRRKIYRGKSVDFSADIVLLPDGKKGIREYAEHPSAVAVIAFTERKRINFKGINELLNNKIVLVRQYRFPVSEITNELPAGKLDKLKNESLIKCARRELEEETGYYAKTIKKLISYWPTPAFSTEALHVFVAYNLRKTGKLPDKDEFLENIEIKFGKALDLVRRKKIKDSKTIIGLLYLYYLVN